MVTLRKKKKSLAPRGGIGTRIVFAIAFVVFLLYAISVLTVFAWSILNSLKTKTEYNLDVFSLPKAFLKAKNPIGALFGNYGSAFKKIEYNNYNMIGMIFNSLWYAVGNGFLSLFFTSMTAYCFAKYNFVGKKVLYAMALLMMMVPILGNFPAVYKLYHQIGLVDSPLILLPSMSGFTGSTLLILIASYKGVSWSYAESAQIDGANGYTIYFRIMFPQVLPPLLTLFILAFIGSWNDYLTPYLYLPNMPTLATGLMVFEKRSIYKPDWPVFYAGVTLMSLPIILLFVCFSDRIMGSISMGGLKG